MNDYVARALEKYDRSKLTLCSIGSHSALEVAYGARAQGLRNLVVTAKGRERTYTEHYIRKDSPVPRGCVDAVIELEQFTDILRDDVQQRLLDANVIFLANRSFEVYLHQKFSYDEIERGMRVPFFGNRFLLRAEERDEAGNQYALMQKARASGIRCSSNRPIEIDRLVMVKAPHAKISFERAFFLVSSPQEYREVSARLIAKECSPKTACRTR